MIGQHTEPIHTEERLKVVGLRLWYHTQQIAQRTVQTLRTAALHHQMQQLRHAAIPFHMGGQGLQCGQVIRGTGS